MSKPEGRLTDYPYMEVRWVDANAKEGWVDADSDLSPSNMVTRGWLYRDEKDYIVLANSLSMDDKVTVGGTNTIPRGMIVSSRKLKVSNASVNVRSKLHTKSSPEELHREPSDG